MNDDELKAINDRLKERRRMAAERDARQPAAQTATPRQPAAQTPTPRKAPSTRGGFFVIELESFHAACAIGLRPAVALLVLARFTGRGGTVTRASANAIEQRTGIGRKAAREAIDALTARGIIRREGSATKPRYIIVRTVDRPDPRGSLTEAQRSVIARCLRGEKLSKRDAAIAANLAARGFVKRTESGGFEESPRDDATSVWLPNELVDGVNGNPSPVELVRQTGDVMALRLLVDLYEWHRLDEWCGVDPSTLRERYKEQFRHAIGAVFVLASTPETLVTSLDKPVAKPHVAMIDGKADARAFWPRLDALQRCGLVRFVPHVIDGDGAVVYPCASSTVGTNRRGEPAEARIGEAAHRAADWLLVPGTEEHITFSDVFEDCDDDVPFNEGVAFIVPRHMEKASVVGIARLTFRPKTLLTARWLSELAQTAEHWEGVFNDAAKHGRTAGIVGAQTADGA